MAREDYGSRAGFETLPFHLKNFTLGRINIYWVCVLMALCLHLLIVLETKNSVPKLFSFPFQLQVNSPNLASDDVFRVNWQNIKGRAVSFSNTSGFRKKTGDPVVHFHWNLQLILILRTLHSARILPCHISDILCKEFKHI